MIGLRSIRLAFFLCAAACVAVLGLAPALALGAETKPQIEGIWVANVTATSASMRAEVDPGGPSTSYFFEYLTEAAYVEAGEEFTEATRAPPSGTAFLGYGNEILYAFQHLSSLAPDTSYVYRLTAENSVGTAISRPRIFTTQSVTPGAVLADNRAWEMVSPVDKNGGGIQAAGENAGGGVLQAAAQGGAITYSSSSSFGEGPVGAPPASQYISRRTESGWTTQNITTFALSGSYGNEPRGVPYQLFAPDLGSGLLLNGEPCRGEGSGCPVDNPPLPGTEAPAGYQNYYVRNDEGAAFTALLTPLSAPYLALSPSTFRVRFVAASPDLRHVVLSTCAKLTADATEVAGSEGCEPAATNLYLWSAGQPELELLNAAPGATIAAQRDSVSTDGSRVYFLEGQKLYLRDSGTIDLVAEGEELEFETATADGSTALYLKEGHLYSYSAASHSSSDLTPLGGVVGVLGASEDGSIVYYQDGNGIERTNGSPTPTTIAPVPQAAQPSDFLPGTAAGMGKGTARVSGDGEQLLFLSKQSQALSGYDDTDASSPVACGLAGGVCDSEVYFYEAAAEEMICVSCNPSGSRPLGPSVIPGAIANGTTAGSTEAYEPRALSADGRRLFFESVDDLLPSDTNMRPDVYEWEAHSEEGCTSPRGCLSLISSGRGEDGASFVDATASGEDAFFLTDQSLVRRDPGSPDIYDARVGGGESEPPNEKLCLSDECAPLPAAPEEPTVGTLTPGPVNPPLSAATRCSKSQLEVIRHGKITCISKKHGGSHHHHRGRHIRTHRLWRVGK
jgi:hypothetical protein